MCTLNVFQGDLRFDPPLYFLSTNCFANAHNYLVLTVKPREPQARAPNAWRAKIDGPRLALKLKKRVQEEGSQA